MNRNANPVGCMFILGGIHLIVIFIGIKYGFTAGLITAGCIFSISAFVLIREDRLERKAFKRISEN